MYFALIASLINVLAQVFIWIIIASALLSFVLSPYHPVRQAVARLVEPLLNPIRRLLPSAGMLDFSPMILILAVWLISRLLSAFLLAFS